MKNLKSIQIKYKALNVRYWLTLTIAITVSLFFVVNYWHYIKKLHRADQSEYSQYEKAANQLIKLNNKSGFFSARFDACHKFKINEICQALYPQEKSSKITPNLSEVELKKAIKANRIESLAKIPQHKALKLYPSLSIKTKEAIHKSLKSEICFPPSLYSVAGLIQENNFPNRQAIDNSILYYKKAQQCEVKNGKNMSSEYGIYRLGLISFWLQKYSLSESAWETILRQGSDSEFRSRASYWLFQIRQMRKQQIDIVEMVKYFTQYPLQFHTLNSFEFVNENKAYELVTESISTSHLPNSKNEIIQNSIQLYRQFIAKDQIVLAQRILEFISIDQLTQSEPEVQLYVALQMNQYTRFNHEKFQILSKLFTQYPRYKTIENLKVFYPLNYGSIIYKSSYHADPYLIFGLIRQESSFNTFAESPVGARGLMQIMPRTAQELKPGVSLDMLKKPSINVQMGSRYIHALIREFKGDVHKALAAYNAGAGNVRRWSRRFPDAKGLLFADLIPYEETREYVANILRNKYWYQKLYPVIQEEDNIAQSQVDEN